MVKLRTPRVLEVGTIKTLSWELPYEVAYEAFVRFLRAEVDPHGSVVVRDCRRRDGSIFVEVSFTEELSPYVIFSVFLTRQLMDEVALVSEGV